MPNLKFYETVTNVPVEKVGKVLGGYKIIANCINHQTSPDPQNPTLNKIQELIIDNKDYPSALLHPNGYIASEMDFGVGHFPKRTIFFYKNYLDSFVELRKDFLCAPDEATFIWECGCVIRKYSMEELHELCHFPWYPFLGEVEICCIPGDINNPEVVLTERKKTKTSEQVIELLVAEGLMDPEKAPLAIALLKKHRKKNRFV
jgi:hypothetical protein